MLPALPALDDVLMVTLPLNNWAPRFPTTISDTASIVPDSSNKPALNSVSGAAVPVATMLMSLGSSSSVPAAPLGARRSALPRKSR